MKFKVLLIFIFISSFYEEALARHLKGGWIQYEYLSTDNVNRTNKYRITVRQFMSCDASGGQIDASVNLTIFDGNNNFLRVIQVAQSQLFDINKRDFDPCINPRPRVGDVCYKIVTYVTEIDLPFSSNGYTLSVQRCCRIENIININNSGSVGLTYSNKIPATINGLDYSKNNSPVFGNNDTVIICHNNYFELNFGAIDVDGDSLVYQLCNGLEGATQGEPTPSQSSRPPYSSVPYSGGFSGNLPMGSNVDINTRTGLISGIAPNATGEYVIAVCALEYRNGVLIGTTRKEIHINVADCQLSAADLNPTYINCTDLNFSFENLNSNSGITGYFWSFGDGNTSTQPRPSHTYSDTGIYKLKLIVTSQGCTDSAFADVLVYPGFVPNFSYSGFCFQSQFSFRNTTFSRYGIVDSLHWNFGDLSTLRDTSSQRNPTYKFPQAGSFEVYLFAKNSKGCRKDTTITIKTFDKPFINLAFKDTLICSIDSVPLKATSTPNATYRWTIVPNNNFIDNRNISNPLVYPKDTTTYIIQVTDSGCSNTDTVKVNVLDFISVDAGVDTSICLTDSYKMKTVSYALAYQWTPSNTLNNPNIKFPIATPTNSKTRYYVKANLGYCQAEDSIDLKTYNYPFARVNKDTAICFGDSVQLIGKVDSVGFRVADTFYWTPNTRLNNYLSLTPWAKPNYTQEYILTSQYYTGCLKPRRDTIKVNIVQPFFVFAGRDTNIVYNQPLQLNAQVLDSSDKFFTWYNVNTNSIFANSKRTTVSFPISADSAIYAVRAFTKEQCDAYDTLKIKIFKTAPSIFIPTGFTPNRDGRNDFARPTYVGISKLYYYSIYNRWGQLIYNTSEIGKGWDGTVGGKKQDPGTYIFIVEADDYLGNRIKQKGTIVLIR